MGPRAKVCARLRSGGWSRGPSLPVAALFAALLRSFHVPFQSLAVIGWQAAQRAGFARPPAVLGVPVKTPLPPDTSRFWIPHLRLSHTEPRVMATSHGEYRGYLRNTIDMEAGHSRFQPVQTSDSTYRSILFGTLVVMGLLQVASSIAILLHLTGYLQEVRLGVVAHFHSHLFFDIAGPVCVKLCL